MAIEMIFKLLVRRDDGGNARGASKAAGVRSFCEVRLSDQKQARHRDKWRGADTSPEKNVGQRIGGATSLGVKARKLAKTCLARLAKVGLW